VKLYWCRLLRLIKALKMFLKNEEWNENTFVSTVNLEGGC
jgi:hypothetical protein